MALPNDLLLLFDAKHIILSIAASAAGVYIGDPFPLPLELVHRVQSGETVW